MVRTPEFFDDYHRIVREQQRVYDREIREIIKKYNCSYKKAQIIRKKRRAERQIQELDLEEQEEEKSKYCTCKEKMEPALNKNGIQYCKRCSKKINFRRKDKE
jgi:hypothetical protein